MAKEIEYKAQPYDWETRAYWEGCGRHELVLQRCRDCGLVQHRPRAICAHCLSGSIDHFVASGRGTVHTFTVIHQNQMRAFRSGKAPADHQAHIIRVLKDRTAVRMSQCEFVKALDDASLKSGYSSFDQEQIAEPGHRVDDRRHATQPRQAAGIGDGFHGHVVGKVRLDIADQLPECQHLVMPLTVQSVSQV